VRFIADMCMDVRVASWLNSQGHDATHLRDEGLQRLPNGGVFEKAIAESRVVVTFDLDYLSLTSGLFWLAPVPNVPDVQWFDRLTMSGSIFRSS